MGEGTRTVEMLVCIIVLAGWTLVIMMVEVPPLVVRIDRLVMVLAGWTDVKVVVLRETDVTTVV